MRTNRNINPGSWKSIRYFVERGPTVSIRRRQLLAGVSLLLFVLQYPFPVLHGCPVVNPITRMQFEEQRAAIENNVPPCHQHLHNTEHQGTTDESVGGHEHKGHRHDSCPVCNSYIFFIIIGLILIPPMLLRPRRFSVRQIPLSRLAPVLFSFRRPVARGPPNPCNLQN